VRARTAPPDRIRAAALLSASVSTAAVFLAFSAPALTAGLPVAGPAAGDGDECRVAVQDWGVTKAPDCAGD
jgi:hypothetical protein